MGSGCKGVTDDLYKLLRNREFISVITKLVIVQLAAALFLFLFLKFEAVRANTAVIKQNTAMIGKILIVHPELETELAALITKGASEAEITAGRKALEKYGYSEKFAAYIKPVSFVPGRSTPAGGALLIIAFTIPLLAVIGFEYQKIFRKVRIVSEASEMVVEGNFSVMLPEGREGDFGILGHSFNQMANRLKFSLDSIKQEKIFLKDIISDISHQLKTPLASLITFNELLRDSRNTDESARLVFLEKSKAQLERMEWLIVNLLKLARLEAGAIILKKENVLMLKAAELSVSALTVKFDSKEQKVHIDAENTGISFTGDLEWSVEALTNILKNAHEHTPPGGSIWIKITETPLFSRISVKDNGEGIDAKDIPHVFDRFYKGTSAVNPEGVGIGLALTKKIIEGQGGTVSVRSEKNIGSEFVITFPKILI